MEQARTELAGFQRELVTARQTLAMLLGRPDLKEAPRVRRAGGSGQLPALLEARAGAVAGQASERGGGPRRAGTGRELELRRARLEPYPDVKVGLAGGRIGETDQSIIQLGFSLPLPIIDRGKGRKQEAQANVSVAEAELACASSNGCCAIGARRSQRYRTAAEQVANYRERILPKANEALRLVQTGFEQGKFGFIDLLDTQRTTAEVRLAYQQKLLELNVAQAELEALLARIPRTKPSHPTSLKPKNNETIYEHENHFQIDPRSAARRRGAAGRLAPSKANPPRTMHHAGHKHGKAEPPADDQASRSGPKCAAHDAPKELCFICDASLRDKGRLWCDEHSRYEDRCWECHPELRTRPPLVQGTLPLRG